MRTGDVHAEGPLCGGRGRLLVRIVQRRHRGFLETGKKEGRKEGKRERNRISIKFRSQGGRRRRPPVRPSVRPRPSPVPWCRRRRCRRRPGQPRSVVRHLVSESKVDEGLITRRERERERAMATAIAVLHSSFLPYPGERARARAARAPILQTFELLIV